MNEVSVGFDDTTATLSVIPGNTYNITVSVISNGLQSDSMVKMNASKFVEIFKPTTKLEQQL